MTTEITSPQPHAEPRPTHERAHPEAPSQPRDPSGATRHGAASDEADQWELPIGGMTCASCVLHVETALSKVEGVESAEVSLPLERAMVRFAPSRVGIEALRRAVEAAGYEAGEPVRSPRTAHAEVPGTSSAAPPKPLSPRDATARQDAEHRTLVRDLVVATLATVPLLVLGMSHGAIPFADAPIGRAMQLVLATIVVLGPGARFFRLAARAARHATSNMNTLLALGSGAAYAYSTAAVLVPDVFPHAEHGVRPHVYFEVAAAVLTFGLLGKVMEGRARRRLTDAVHGLVALQPATARRLRGLDVEEVPVAALSLGDRVLVRPGERVPADGVVREGRSAVDESMLSGESLPVDKAPGASLHGGTLNQSGALTMEVTALGEATTLARIVRAVEDAQGRKAPIARLTDQVASVFVPVVLVFAALAFAVWVWLDPTSDGVAVALERLVAVLVVACPCALGLAAPASVAVGTGRGAELGILVKGGAALESASRIDTVLLDKTGTLTEGHPRLTDVVTEATDEPSLLALLASAEQASEHPVARAIVEGARARGIALRPATEFSSQAGGGASAVVDGRHVLAGTAAYLAESGVDASSLEGSAHRLAMAGRTPVLVALDGAPAGVVAVADRIKPEAHRVIDELTALGVEVAMVTGDREAVARAVAQELGITRVFAGVRPEEKADVVRREREAGRRVAMVGDGVNDAPALAAADLGVALGSGADVAVAAADVALVRGDLGRLPVALRLGRKTLSNIRANLFWAFAYNVAGIPLAAGALVLLTGTHLSPVVASAAMSLSSVSVLLSALRLGWFERTSPLPAPARPGPARALAAAAMIALAMPSAELAAQAEAPIEIVVDGGYRPSRVEVQAGRPVRLRFVRHEYSGCTREVVFPSLGVRRELPPHVAVELDLGILAPGEYAFQCGMGMIHGLLVVRAS